MRENPEFLTPITARRDPEFVIDEYEMAAARMFAENMVWPDKTTDDSVYCFTTANFRSTLTLQAIGGKWTNTFTGRYNQIREIGTGHFDLPDTATRIDSAEFQRVCVSLFNALESDSSSTGSVYVNGTDAVAVGDFFVASAPLTFAGLAEATKGGYIALNRNIVRFLGAVCLAAEFRRAHNLPGGAVEIMAAIGNDGSFILRVSTAHVRILVEQAVLVRPFFDEDVVAKALCHEPEVLATLNTASARRAYRSAVKAAFGKTDADPLATNSGESTPFTALLAGESGVFVTRLKTNSHETVDVQDWNFSMVPNSAVLSSLPEGKRPWQVVDGSLFEVLPFLSDTLTLGITDARDGAPYPPPLVAWNDNGLRLSVSTAAALAG